MAWIRLDDAMLDNAKVAAAGPIGFALHVAAIVYCARNLTDGFVPYGHARRLLAVSWTEDYDNPDPQKGPLIWTLAMGSGMKGYDGQTVIEHIIDTLLEVGLWEDVPHGYVVHDYLEYNPSKVQVLAARSEREEAGRRGGLATAKAKAIAGAQANTQALAVAQPQANRHPVPVPVPVEGLENKETRALLETTERHVELNGSTALEIEVFETWKTSTGKSGRTRLDPKRRRLIKQALAEYPVEDVLDAVEGWSFIAHNRGENDRHRKFNDLELLLQDSQHIERFRDAKRGQGEVVAVESGAEYHRLWVDPYAAEEAARDARRQAGLPD